MAGACDRQHCQWAATLTKLLEAAAAADRNECVINSMRIRWGQPLASGRSKIPLLFFAMGDRNSDQRCDACGYYRTMTLHRGVR